MSEWYFEPFSANGGFNAAAGRRLLEGAELQQAETLARESIQNSCDAEDSQEGPVRVMFRARTASGADAERVAEVLQLHGPQSPTERRLVDVGENLQLLFIEDFNTRGLGGTERADISSRPEDNFVRLCRNVGDTQESAGRGGTFGFGKSVYWSHSRLYLVAFYSRFKPTERTGGATSRFMAVGWFHDHDHADSRYTGRAWLGDVRRENGSEIVAPLVDEEADRMADSLGFQVREGADYGTSILVVGAHQVDRAYVARIREAVETHYWPRILDGRLDVSFEWEDDLLGGPDLSARVELRDYMKAYSLATQELIPDELPEGQTVMPLEYTPQGSNRTWNLGRAAVVVRHGASGTSGRDAEQADSTRRGVALLRKPRMVVTYYTWTSLPDVPCGAVFVASDEIEDYLRRSEPPAHDRWSDQSNDLDQEGRKIVQRLMGKIRGSVAEYLDSFIETESTDSSTCPALGQELARYLPLRPGGRGTGSTPRYASVQFLSQPHRLPGEEGHQRVAAEILVGVTDSHLRRYRQHQGDRARSVSVAVRIDPVIETGRRLQNHPIGVEVLSDSRLEGHRANGSLILPLAGEGQFRISIVSEPLPEGELTVDMAVTANLRTEEVENGRSD